MEKKNGTKYHSSKAFLIFKIYQMAIKISIIGKIINVHIETPDLWISSEKLDCYKKTVLQTKKKE